MKAIKRYITTLLIALLIVPGTLAQTIAAGQGGAKDVQIIIQPQQVRFLASPTIAEMHLQVFDPAGTLVFDSGPAGATEINWSLQNASGEALKSGLYAYTLSLKEAGATETRERRGHFILDRAKDRDGKTDKLWVTSQNDDGVGTELTVARDESATIAGASAPARDKLGRENEAEAKKDLAARKDALNVAGAGTTGQIAKFISGEEVGDSQITEVEGNVGIGTAAPATKLDVRGNLALEAGGSPTLFTAAGGGEQNRYLNLINSPNYLSASGLKAGGILVSDSYAFANPGKNDLIVKGKTGFGTAGLSPSRVTIEGQDALTARGYEPFLNLQDTNDFFFQNSHRIQSAHGDLNFFQGYYQPSSNPIALRQYVYIPRMVIKDSGNVGIGTSAPNHQLSLGRGPTWTRNGWGGSLELQNATAIAWQANSAGQRFGMGHTNTGFYIFRTTSDPGTAVSPANYDLSISDTGVTSVRVLQITGGADFAENFDVNSAPAGTGEPSRVKAGMVVSIDTLNPGKLALSAQAYDHRVAGIISGAGGVNPGMTMSQEGTLAEGKHPVALSGRVYCWVDASQGAVEPGDLLTTSATPGHAMKVTDAGRAQGAIIGKAMTGLKEGKGLVLVLVTLQ